MGTIVDLLRENLLKIESEINSAWNNQCEDEDKNAEQLHEVVHKIHNLSYEAAKYYADYHGWPVPFNEGCGG